MTPAAPARNGSPLHQLLIAKALARFHAELGTDDSGLLDVQGPEELLVQARSLDAPQHGGSKPGSSLFRLESVLSHMSDFAAIVALSSGSGKQVTGVVWGSLKIILMVSKICDPVEKYRSLTGPAKLVHRNRDKWDEVLSMLDELSLALPRFRIYEDTLPMTPELESALVDVYTEMTCFCARTIKFFRASPHHFLIRAGWSKYDGDFKQTVKRLKSLSQIVDGEAEAVRLRVDSKKNNELAEALESLKVIHSQSSNIPCYCIPQVNSKEFFGRQDVMKTLEASLIENDTVEASCVLLHGLGGVGKTRLALHFANTHRDKFDAVLWVSADSTVKVEQSFLVIAQRLGLLSDDNKVDDVSSAIANVKQWLMNSDYRWLMIFDNVDDAETLEHAWLGAANGSILVTGRDSTIAFGTAMTSCHVQPFDNSLGASALLSLVGHSSASERDKNSATEIIEALGGLPLAINQISGFIVQQRLSLAEFLPLYERNATKIDQRSLYRGGDEQTLSTVWAIALDRLPRSSSTLQSLLALFDPDGVQEIVLEQGCTYLAENELEFLKDEMDFLDAKEPLLRSALIERNAVDSSISMHRLVQAAVIKRLPDAERSKLLDGAIIILSHGFPNTWNAVTTHQYASWGQCEVRVAHVKSLLRKSQKYNIRVEKPNDYAELVFRVAWYLYERESYDEAEQFLTNGLRILGETATLMYASACTLRGLIELDTKRVSTALESFLEGLRIREKLLHPDDAFIASSLNAISLSYTELNELDKAVEYGDRAIDIRLRTQSDRIGNSYSNMASTLLRMGRPDEAEEMLGRCPALKDFTDATFLASGNPRFAGDMVLLGRIREKQGRLDEALRLASKALTFRQTTHGNRLKTCDSLQQVARLLEDKGDTDSAIYFLKQSTNIAESLPYGEGYVALANHRLARIFKMIGDDRQAVVCTAAADAAKKRAQNLNGHAPGSDQDFDTLVPWMLW